MKNYTDKKFWDEYFNHHQHELSLVGNPMFSDIFDKYLEPNKNKKVLEIGCANSIFLCYLAKKFGYKAYGVDYSDAIVRTANLFKFNNLSEPTLYKEDFFSWKPNMKFDVVCSFGFVEHFFNIQEIIKKHADLVAPNGKLIITLPHFGHGQYFLHWLIDRENLKKHNTKIMNLGSIRQLFKNLPFEIEHLSYYKTFGFWTERIQMAGWEKVINWKILKFSKVITKVFGYNRPNFLFSPHIVCVTTKQN